MPVGKLNALMPPSAQQVCWCLWASPLVLGQEASMAYQAAGYYSAPGWHAGIIDIELIVVAKGLQQGVDLDSCLEPHDSSRGAARGVKVCLAYAHLR